MKNLMNLGKVLNRNEQKAINGGGHPIFECGTHQSCERGYYCDCGVCVPSNNPFIVVCV